MHKISSIFPENYETKLPAKKRKEAKAKEEA